MTTKRRSRLQDNAADYLEKLMGGPLTLGGALAAIRESDGESLSEFSERLGISRTHLSDIEHGRRAVSLERAARFAEVLGQSQAQFVRLALQAERSPHFPDQRRLLSDPERRVFDSSADAGEPVAPLSAFPSAA